MEHSRKEEFQLIKNILDGQQGLYRRLIDQYSPMVFHIVRRFVNDEDEVEELAQQIFVKCYERLDSFDMKSKFSSWLYMIAKNHCRDYAKNVRRKNKRFSEMEQHNLEAMMTTNETPDQSLEQEEWNNLLDEALDSLSPEYAQAFLYKYRDEMTYQAMAKRMNVSVSALKVRVHRARKELKEYFESRGGNHE
ncbi:RNA polymerase sigma factor [Aliifodinibius sp. S!AR15-10]|uniref:RNA polymerase sigma factor n=1 Tax=Aliifodinibius sp. S!AR15-10 TaxID=2950437 RepID=UPI002864689E|nr:RNA polymerase sigma factor [Aliifodinibius sp. S!AR15-10]MDR8390302.1 RNA polymerase sigma factor [Aliifodinibius sp. S!AR15-10]